MCEGALDGLEFFLPTSWLKNYRFCPFLGQCQKEGIVGAKTTANKIWGF
jgi:hypothetical protein